ncbi:unnamed protein product [Allacma fusca]|uniref:Gamma-glutamyl transpeptidase n=1 Tax=Allacma fusca TaxID=39272 RepID=A0A8J2K0Z7_9HEXA|nr:unnamed protein product [Allacma fusca]
MTVLRCCHRIINAIVSNIWKCVIIGIVVVVLLVAGIAAIILLLQYGKPNDSDPPDELPPPSYSKLGHYSKAAISCDAPKCAEIGKKVLMEKGTIADAAIATLLCVGVIHSQSMGVGGGFLMVYYKKDERKVYALNARERAPGKATENMFEGNSTLSVTGGLAVAVPGEMKGYWELYKKFGGGVPWKRILQPTIDLCKNGFVVTNHTASAFAQQKKNIFAAPSMKAIFVNPATGELYKEGDTIYRRVFGETLQKIADDDTNGGDLLYQESSDLAKWLVEDLQEMGGILTLEDLGKYTVTWVDPIRVPLSRGFTVFSIPPPGSGVISSFILRVLDKYKFSSQSLKGSKADSVIVYHRIIEAFKHAYAKRTVLGDPFDPNITDFINKVVYNMTASKEYLDSIHKKIKSDSTSHHWEDYGAEFYQKDGGGTSHVSIIGENGDAIAVTSTINLYFGARIRSNRTGIIYNDEMDDFSAPNITNSFGIPPSPHNFIKPGKRPLSSMCPTIVVDGAGNVRLVVGTAGGTRITSATAYVSVRNIMFNETIKEAIDARRLHHQLAPMEGEYQTGFLKSIVKGLEKIGHKMVQANPTLGSITMGVARSQNGSLWANCDFRKVCSVDGY